MGSWIRGDFDIWIGDPEENRGWESLGQTRDFLRRQADRQGYHARTAQEGDAGDLRRRGQRLVLVVRAAIS